MSLIRGTPQLLCLFIHHLHKPLPASPHVFRQGIGGLVAGQKHHHVETVLHRDLIPLRQGQFIAGPGLQIVDRVIGKRHRLIHLAVLHHHKGSQKLQNTGRRVGNVDLLSEKNGLGIRVNDNARPSHDPHIPGPGRRLCKRCYGAWLQDHGSSHKKANNPLFKIPHPHSPPISQVFFSLEYAFIPLTLWALTAAAAPARPHDLSSASIPLTSP